MSETSSHATTTALEKSEPKGLQNFAGYGPAEYNALKETLAKGAGHAEFKAFLMLCQHRGLEPGVQIHFVKRRSRVDGQWVESFAPQTGIDGYRALAERTGLYEGPCGEPLYQYEEGGTWTEDILASKLPYAAKVGVYRRGRREPVWATATYRHYVQLKKRGEQWVPTEMWAKMPHPQLAKCAEALALRKAFPQDLGGIFTHEEMQQAANGAPGAEERENLRIDPASTPEARRGRLREGAERLSFAPRNITPPEEPPAEPSSPEPEPEPDDDAPGQEVAGEAEEQPADETMPGGAVELSEEDMARFQEELEKSTQGKLL